MSHVLQEWEEIQEMAWQRCDIHHHTRFTDSDKFKGKLAEIEGLRPCRKGS